MISNLDDGVKNKPTKIKNFAQIKSSQNLLLIIICLTNLRSMGNEDDCKSCDQNKRNYNNLKTLNCSKGFVRDEGKLSTDNPLQEKRN